MKNLPYRRHHRFRFIANFSLLPAIFWGGVILKTGINAWFSEKGYIMLKYNIRNLMKMRGIANPIAFLKENGFTRGTAGRIAAEKMKIISPPQIEKLCILLNCLPNDLYCWIADKEETANESHPLWKIRQQEMKSFPELYFEIPSEKMPGFLEKVKQIKEEMKG